MDKIWHLNIEGREEGPYSIQDLRRHPSVTPDTLAWREGMDTWKPIRQIPELEELFEEKHPPEEEEEKGMVPSISPDDEEVALSFYKDPNFLILWLLIAVLIFLYFFYAFNRYLW